MDLEDAYLSVKEALIHAVLAEGYDLEIEWISSESLEKGRELERLEQLHGIVVPGGFGYRGIEGKIVAANYRPHAQRPLSWPLPRHAGALHRVCARRVWKRRTQ